MVCEKNFMTPFGKMTLPRKVYQADRGKKTHGPLDTAWDMEGQFATIEVREVVFYLFGLITPMEAETVLKKGSLFHPSSTAIKRMVNEMGEWFEAHDTELRDQVQAKATVPENTRVLTASLDGVNLLLREPGERPGKQENTSQCTSYKNAMVGSITCYGDVPEGQNSPHRLGSTYVARMPEDRALTFKQTFEEGLRSVASALPENVIKVVVCDGARGLWNYIEKNNCFDESEKILDYFHVAEHLSLQAEALVGKQSETGIRWYNKYKEKLLNDDLAPQAILRSVNYYLETEVPSDSCGRAGT